MIGKRFRSLPFIFANDNYTLRDNADAKFPGQPKSHPGNLLFICYLSVLLTACLLAYAAPGYFLRLI